jgi:hypothetical protein
VFRHSREPQILDSVPATHLLHGLDLRTLSDEILAEAAAHAILPGFERVQAYSDHSNEERSELSDLTSSAFRRITRILIQHIRIEKNSGHGGPSLEIQDEILEAMTLTFVHMVGVFDALAIVNGILTGQTKYKEMGWQRKDFCREMRKEAPGVMALLESQVAGGKFLRAVMDFRNTIHRRMPDPATSGRSGGDPALHSERILLERRSHDEILDSFQVVGWTKHAGVDLAGDSLLLRPETVVRLVLNDGIPLINRLMDATPIERLGARRRAADPDKTLYPTQLKEYAVEYLGLTHLTEAR